MAYRMGFCPCCDKQIMVQDTNRLWSSWMPDFRQVDLTFEDGGKCRSPLCKDCLESADIRKIYDALIHNDSQAGNDGLKNSIKARGVPVLMTISNTPQGASYKG